MRFTLSLFASALAVANAAVIGREAAALEVTLTPAANSAGQVIATVKNVGAEALNLVTLGTFLDSAPVDKLNVLDESGMFFCSFIRLPFVGRGHFDIPITRMRRTFVVEILVPLRFAT